MKNPTGLCMCGCGERTDPSPTSRRGYKRGEPLMFIKGHCNRKPGPKFMIDQFGCWVWLRYADVRWGYGRMWDGEKVRGAHVVYYEREYGPVPEGCDVHHLCGRRLCVNPRHLQAVTRREHMALEGRRPFGNARANPVSA